MTYDEFVDLYDPILPSGVSPVEIDGVEVYGISPEHIALVKEYFHSNPDCVWTLLDKTDDDYDDIPDDDEEGDNDSEEEDPDDYQNSDDDESGIDLDELESVTDETPNEYVLINDLEEVVNPILYFITTRKGKDEHNGVTLSLIS